MATHRWLRAALIGGPLLLVIASGLTRAQDDPNAAAQRGTNDLAERDAGTVSRAERVAHLPHATGEFKIDGVLDEEIWREALVVELLVETHPRENTPAPVQTHAYLVEDGSTLLIAFDARDPNPSAIRAYLRDRDSAFNDDFVGVVLDTFNDQRRAFEFFVNPLGVQMDLTQDDVNRNESEAWDAIWDSAGTITSEGFVVEMAIPFSQLRFPRTDGEKIWGVDILRFYPRADRVRLSNNPQDRGRNCYLCQLSKIRGFANAEPGKDLEVVPSVTASRTDEREAVVNAPLVKGDEDAELGVNVRWGITPDVTANLALNPDFSQVEADVAQLDVNNQFALFFPETRPFFLEGADFFATPFNAVFTRTIADPDVGAKVTGRSGAHTFGFFAADDARTDLLFPGALGSSTDSLEQSNRSLVGRYSRGFGAASTMGALVTRRSGDDYHNEVRGIDGRYRISDQHNIRFQYLTSDTEYPSATASELEQPLGSFSGDAMQLNYDFGTREWFAFLNHESVEPGFRADTGFLPRVDIEQHGTGFGRVWHGESHNWWNRLQLGANWNKTEDHSGQLLDRRVRANFNIQGPMQSFAQIGVARRKEFFDGQLYDIDNRFMFGQIRPRGGLNFTMSIERGDRIDFANSRLGKQLYVESGVDWNLNRHMLLRLRHTASELETQAGERIFDARLTDFRVTWQFNVRAFLRLTMQRQRVTRNLAVFEDQDTDAHSVSLASQLLYSYKLNPQTVFFLGYSDNRLEDDDLPSLTQTGRTLFVKLSYAWTP